MQFCLRHIFVCIYVNYLYFYNLLCGSPYVCHFIQLPHSKNCISYKSISYLLLVICFNYMYYDTVDTHILFKCAKSHLAHGKLHNYLIVTVSLSVQSQILYLMNYSHLKLLYFSFAQCESQMCSLDTTRKRKRDCKYFMNA